MDEARRMRFLVIEDEDDTARLVALLLERRFPAGVDIAGSCSEARAAMAKNSYDVITLDYQLPDCTGIDMLDEITREEDHPPVIMITAHGDEELAYLSFRMGASGYAAKDRKLPVILPDAVEWALADARLKRSRPSGESDERLHGLAQAAHAMARDLRMELETARQEGETVAAGAGACEADMGARLEMTSSTIEMSLTRALALVDKLDSLVDPLEAEADRGPGRTGAPGD